MTSRSSTRIDAVPRERFVLPGREELAYSDQELPVSEGAERRFMLTPMVLARMIQALEIDAGDKVLDVACGRGYSSAILSKLGAHVTALESDSALAEAARKALAAAGFEGVAVETRPPGGGIRRGGALRRHSGERRDRDATRSTAAAAERRRPPRLCDGRGRAGRATLYVRSGDAWGERSLFDAAAPVLTAFRAEAGLCLLISR